ncbi:hypothetical protein EX30DRAFT_184786 [Ascodesmis nigricans]|uniref:Uncharacterized protein n=1 Tax=Ascodesmis nigricans TaxID=341454 RepID=A0A4S2N091_9PEZI|nr:hypothetical protein EX30DRAFT_184786 [Ascodesmis nigricans]
MRYRPQSLRRGNVVRHPLYLGHSLITSRYGPLVINVGFSTFPSARHDVYDCTSISMTGIFVILASGGVSYVLSLSCVVISRCGQEGAEKSSWRPCRYIYVSTLVCCLSPTFYTSLHHTHARARRYLLSSGLFFFFFDLRCCRCCCCYCFLSIVSVFVRADRLFCVFPLAAISHDRISDE